MSKLEKITFRPEGEEPVEFYVLEQTRIGGHNYILVTDVEEGDVLRTVRTHLPVAQGAEVSYDSLPVTIGTPSLTGDRKSVV